MKSHKFTVLFIALSSVFCSMAANAAVSYENEQGRITFGGDVEFNVDYEEKNNDTNKKFEFDQNGRILLDVSGVRETKNNINILFKVQPLVDTSGKINLDDAWFGIESKNDWLFKIGRFEAYDMFPVGQDTFLEYTGDSSNELYSDNGGYSYQMKEGRGRASSSGQIMVSKTIDDFYMELATVIGDRTELFQNARYHGRDLTENGVENKDFIVARPVLAYQLDRFKFSLGMEKNLATDAIVTNEGDVSDRTGYGFTTTYKAENFILNVNAAYMNALNEKNTSYGANFIWNHFGLGYIYSVNDFDKASGWYAGEVEVQTWNASYEFKNIFDVSDFSVFLGAYFTEEKGNGDSISSDADYNDNANDIGARVRVKYFF